MHFMVEQAASAETSAGTGWMARKARKAKALLELLRRK
jgi:hypothetical protein